jgi:hypothetical protein
LSYAVPVDTSIRYTITVIQIKNIFIFVIQVLFGLKNFKFPIHSLWTKTSAILKKLVWPVKNTQFRALKSCYSFGNLSRNWIVKFISFILGRPEESSPGEEAEVGSIFTTLQNGQKPDNLICDLVECVQGKHLKKGSADVLT